MDFAGYEFLTQFLGEAARADLSQKIFVFAVAWSIVRKTIKTHLEKIEKGLGDVAKSVQELNAAMTRLESNHENRIVKLEKGFEDIHLNHSKGKG